MDGRKGEPCIDTETGEILYPSLYNAETGEYEGLITLPQKIKFRIPPQQKLNKMHNIPIKVNKHELELLTAAIFLLPTIILFYPILSIFIFIMEIILHNWVHKKNKTLRDDTFYYKSPLHCIVKEFCGRCKDLSTKEKITKMQDKRTDKMRKYGLESIRRVVT